MYFIFASAILEFLILGFLYMDLFLYMDRFFYMDLLLYGPSFEWVFLLHGPSFGLVSTSTDYII